MAFAGIIGALGGAGASLADAGSAMMKSDLEGDRQIRVATATNDLELQRQQALERFKADEGDRLRQQQVTRVDAATQPIIASRLATKYADSDAAVAAADAGQTDAPLTPEQKGVIAQAKQQDTSALQNDPKVRMQAAISTGDISPEKAATMGQSAEINQMKLDALLARSEDRNQSMQQIAQIRADAMMAAAQLRVDAANQRATNGKVDNATTRMLVTSEDANIRASTSQLNMLMNQLNNTPKLVGGKPNPAFDSITSQMEDLRTDIATSKKTKADLFQNLGITPKDSGSPAPSPAATPTDRPPLSTFQK